MAVSPSHDRLFRQALARRAGGDKKGIDRSVGFRARSPYPLFFLWGIFVGVAAYLFLASPLLEITEISASGEERLSGMRIEHTVEAALSGKTLGLFSRRNYLFLPTRDIEAALRDAYPLIKSVSVRPVFPRRLEINVTERPTLLLWCSGGPCYLLDEEGRAFANDRALFEMYATERRVIVDTSALPVHVGEPFEGIEYLRHFEALFDSMPARLNLRLRQEASTASHFSRELRLVTDVGWTLLVSTEIPVEETLSVLSSFLESRAGNEAQANPLMLVDARVPGRIFYSELNQATGEASEPKAAEPAESEPEKPKTKKKKEARE